MKRFFPTLLAFIFLFQVNEFTASAQCTITTSISGNACTGHALTAVTSSIPSSIAWQKNGITVHTEYPSQWSSQGIVIAGGNGQGSGANQLGNYLSGVAVDKDGNIYVCDDANHRIQKYAPGATIGVTVAGGNGEGGGANQLDYPQDVFVDDSGNMYIADDGNARIQKWTPGATSGTTVAGGNFFGSGANQFSNPFQVVVDKEGNIYVADINNYRVQKWVPGATSGVTVAGGNGQGSADNQISYTSYIFIDDSENLYVSDEYNLRITKWTPGATSGITVAGGNGSGIGANQLSYATGIFVDGSGNVFVANGAYGDITSSVMEWKRGATTGTRVGAGSPYEDGNYFNNSDITIDRNGNIIVADVNNYRVLQYNLTNLNYTYSPSSSGNYMAIATDFKSFCTATSNSIPVAASPVINSSVNGSLCSGSGVALTAFGGSTFIWQPGSLQGATQTFYPNGTSTYSVSSDVNSCVSEITIPVITSPSISISGKACTNQPLSASINGIPASIQWQKNGVTQETGAPSWNTSGTTVAGGNGYGGASNQLSQTYLGIFADALGNVYIADEGNNRIQKWAPGATSGVTVAGGNYSGSSSNQLSGPTGIYVDASGNIYIADYGNQRVQEWAPGASNGITVAGGHGQGGDSTQLSNPIAVSVDAAGNVYVLDRGNNRVQKWAPGASSGVTVAGGNGQGAESNQIDYGTGLFVDEDENVYVDEWYAGRVQKWAPGATSGVPVMTNLNLPYGLWRDAAGYFYVINEPYISSYYTSQVARGREGEYQFKTIVPASYGSGANQLASAYNGCFDPQGNMYILDASNYRVQKFTPASIDTTYSPLSFGDYTAVTTDFSGCSAISNTIHATTSPGVSSSTLSICNGSSTVLSVAGSGGFTWNPGGESGSSVTVSPTSSTTYTVTNDTNNCQSTIAVNVNPLITTTLTGPNCLGSGNLSASISSTPLQLDWKLNGNTIQSTTASYSYLTSSVVFGGNGNGTGLNQLGAPEHMCFDDAGNLYISELANSRVTKWAPGAAQGVVVAGGNGQGPNDNQTTWPFGVFVDHSGNLYVSDWINHRVQKWAPGATSGVTVAGGNGEGSALNQLDFPSGIYVDGAGNIYIADEDNSRVVEWAPGAAQGVIVAGGNGQGSAANQFNGAIDVHVDQSGNIYVCDRSNHRIQKWTPGAISGVTIAGNGTLGYGPVELNDPEGFAFDGAGNMYIMNTYYNTIWKWTPGATQGVYLAAYCCSGQGSLQNATDVAIDMNGNLYACDVGADKIVKYPVNSFSSTYNPTSAGAYSIIATSFAGCAAISNTINIHLVPTISLTGNQSYCTGSTTTLDAGTHQTYSWSTGSTNESETFGASGKYAIIVSDSGCSKTDSFSINNATPQVQATASYTNICGGQSTILNVQLLSGNGQGNSYTWNPGNLNGASVQVTPSATTTYTLTAMNSGCSSTSSVTVNITSPQGDPAVFGNNVWNVYAWNAGGQYDYGQSWNTNYAGYYADTTLNFNSTSRWDQGTSPSHATGYQGCPVQVDNMSWSAKRKGFPCGVYQIDMPLHDDEEQLLINGIVVSTNYCCGNVNNLWTGELGANSTVEFRVTEGGGYSNGALNFTIVPVPILAHGPSTICPGYSLPISVDTTDAASYVWNTGETTSTIEVNTAGIYTVNVDYRSGCASSNSFTLNINAIDTPALTSYTGFAFCPINQYADAQVTNFNPQLNYIWNSQNAYDYGGGYFVFISSGDFTLTTSDALGCSAQSHVSISGPPSADSIFGNNVWKVNAYAEGDQSDYGYSWLLQDYSGYYIDSSLNFNSQNKWDENSNPSTAPGYQGCSIYDDYMSWSAKRQGFPCGIYQIDVLNHDDEGELFVNGVMVWSHDGCCDSHTNVWTGPLNSSSKVEFKVTEGGGASNGALQFTLKDTSSAFITVSGNSNVCTGQSYTLNSIQGASYLWSDGETTNPSHPTQSGSYSVTVTDAAGCSITSAPIHVNILSQIAPVSHITTSSNTVCNWNPVTLSSDSVSGNQWSTNDTTRQINTIAEGTYTLTVKNSAGCTAQSSIDITDGFTPPAPPVATNNGPACQNSPVNLTVSGLAPGGQAASLNGSTYINVVQDIPENDFTIEMWVKTTDPNAGIFSATDDNSGTSDRSLFLQNGQLWVSLIYDNPWNSGFTINDGQWHHIALVVQSGVGQIIYVDGVSSGIGGYYDQSYFTWQTAFRIGDSFDAIHQSFNGQIDNVRIWSEARSQDDIRNNLLLETPASTNNLVYEAALNGNLNAVVGTNGIITGSISYLNTDYFTYTWTGAGAPPPSRSETQTIAAASSSGTYSVTVSTAGGCNASSAASTNVSVTTSVSYYPDADGDGYGSSSATAIQSCTNPGAGYVTNNTDCDDGNANVHPGAVEICNGIDDNCNGQIDEGVKSTFYADADGDGYGNPNVSTQSCAAPAGYVSDNTDCNDNSTSVHPGAAEICNNIDDNCNGQIDEGVKTTFYADADGDGYGTSTSSVQACTAPAGYVSNNTDCNDANKNVHPGASDICNGIDDNCNGVIDENAITATVTPNGTVTFCAGSNITLTANSGSGISYQWLKNNKNISGATKQTYTTAANGNYQVKENNSFSCNSTSTTASVTKVAKPAAVIIALGNLNICTTGSVTLQANAGTGLKYQWMKGAANIAGATQRNYVATTTGTYKCVVANSFSCSKVSNPLKVIKTCGKLDEDNTDLQPVLSIYPNPTNGQFMLDLKTNEVSDGPAKIMVINIVGQIVYAENGSIVNGELQQEINFPASASSGLYITKVICENHTYEGKVIYQH